MRIQQEGMCAVEVQKAFVRHDGKTAITCNSCGTIKTVDTTKLNKCGRPLRVRCSCQAVFRVFFEFRGAYRKKTTPDAYYAKLSAMTQWLKMRVYDVSVSGVGFSTPNKNALRKGDILKLKLSSDDGKRSRIEKKAVVKWVQDRYVGCKFMDKDQYTKTIGFH